MRTATSPLSDLMRYSLLVIPPSRTTISMLRASLHSGSSSLTTSSVNFTFKRSRFFSCFMDVEASFAAYGSDFRSKAAGCQGKNAASSRKSSATHRAPASSSLIRAASRSGAAWTRPTGWKPRLERRAACMSSGMSPT